MRQAVRRKYHYIYKITRKDGSGKYYIGMHSTDDLDDGYFGSGSLLSKSIKKHGKEKHIKEIIEYLPTREALKLREKEIVNEELLGDRKCMNLKLGGEGGGKFWTAEQQLRATVAGNQSPKRDKKAAAEKANATKKANGIFGWRGVQPKINGMLGKSHSKETIKKMSEAKLGVKNNQFGTCWIMKDTKSIKIKKEMLEIYLADGYVRGRLMS